MVAMTAFRPLWHYRFSPQITLFSLSATGMTAFTTFHHYFGMVRFAMVALTTF
jgi:hypothetical protein